MYIYVCVCVRACVWVCVPYVNTNKFAIVVIRYGPLKKKKKKNPIEAIKKSYRSNRGRSYFRKEDGGENSGQLMCQLIHRLESMHARRRYSKVQVTIHFALSSHLFHQELIHINYSIQTMATV